MESSREFCCSLDDFGIRYNIDPQQFVLHTVLNSVLNFVKLYLVGYLLKSTSPKIRSLLLSCSQLWSTICNAGQKSTTYGNEGLQRNGESSAVQFILSYLGVYLGIQ